jgi:hypothetical protein
MIIVELFFICAIATVFYLLLKKYDKKNVILETHSLIYSFGDTYAIEADLIHNLILGYDLHGKHHLLDTIYLVSMSADSRMKLKWMNLHEKLSRLHK